MLHFAPVSIPNVTSLDRISNLTTYLSTVHQAASNLCPAFPHQSGLIQYLSCHVSQNGCLHLDLNHYDHESDAIPLLYMDMKIAKSPVLEGMGNLVGMVI